MSGRVLEGLWRDYSQSIEVWGLKDSHGECCAWDCGQLGGSFGFGLDNVAACRNPTLGVG